MEVKHKASTMEIVDWFKNQRQSNMQLQIH